MLPILCYHKVGSAAEEGRRLNVSPSTLESHVRYFCRKGKRFARAGDLETGLPKGCVCLTFDDAYHSALTHGLEVLLRNGVWGTFYAVPSLVGSFSEWDPGYERPLAGWQQLLAAQAEGMEVGNHTFSHADLSKLTLAEQIAELEMAEDLLIEHGLSPKSVCFPYGKFNGATLEAMDSEGVQVGMALGTRQARTGDDLRALPRLVVGFSDRLPKLLYRLYLRPRLPSLKRRAHYVR